MACFGMKTLICLLMTVALTLPALHAQETLSPDAAARWIAGQDEVQVLDVRTLEEYKRGHLKDALRVTWGGEDFKAQARRALDKDKPVLVYCRSGRRSAAAAEVLEGMGFSKVRGLDGGILAWQKAGKAVTK